MIVSATWPILLRLEACLRGKRSLAVVTMTLLLTLLVLAPLVTAVGIILANTDRLIQWIEALSRLAVVPPPEWLESIPLVGPQAAKIWHEINTAGTVGLAGKWRRISNLTLVVQLGHGNPASCCWILTVIIAGVLYSTGEIAAQGVLRFCPAFGWRTRRNRGDIGSEIGSWFGAGGRGNRCCPVGCRNRFGHCECSCVLLLTALMFILCLAQLGPSLYWFRQLFGYFGAMLPVGQFFLAVWTVLVTPIDNVLRPILIRKSVDLSIFVVLPGVIGGLMTRSIIGVFVGPVVLAVAYSLLEAWVAEGEHRPHDFE